MQSRYQNLTHARRRGSVGSFSLTDSDEEIDEAQTKSHTPPSRAESSRKRLPDYMNLGGADSTPFNPENFYSRFAHALNGLADQAIVFIIAALLHFGFLQWAKRAARVQLLKNKSKVLALIADVTLATENE